MYVDSAVETVIGLFINRPFCWRKHSGSNNSYNILPYKLLRIGPLFGYLIQ